MALPAPVMLPDAVDVWRDVLAGLSEDRCGSHTAMAGRRAAVPETVTTRFRRL